MKLNMNRRGFLKVTGAAGAAAAVAPAALAEIAPTVLSDVKTHIRSFDYFECVEMSGSPNKVQYYNRHSERFQAFYADRSNNWRIKSLTREDMADNLGEHVVEILDADPENFIMSSWPGDSQAYVAAMLSSDEAAYDGQLVIEKITFKENHKVWGLS